MTSQPATDTADAQAPPAGGDRALKLLLGLAAVIVAAIGASQLSDFVAPAFMALNVMIVVWPVQRWLSRRTAPWFGALAAGLLAVVALGLLFWAIGWAASALIRELPSYGDRFTSLYTQGITLLEGFGITATQITTQLSSIDVSSLAGTIGSVLSSVGGGVSLLVVVLSVLLFLVIDSMDFDRRLQQVADRHNPVLILALRSFARGVRMYWVTATVFGAIVSVLTYFGLLLLGVPLALVWAVLAFVTNFIPNVGFVIGLVPAALMGLLEKGWFGFFGVIILYSVLNFVIQSVIQPKMVGDAVGVTATVSFLSLLVWASVLGALGALLALPATLLLKALLIDADPRARWLNAFIAANPKTADEEPVIDTNVRLRRPWRRRAGAVPARGTATSPDVSPVSAEPRYAWTEDDLPATETDPQPTGTGPTEPHAASYEQSGPREPALPLRAVTDEPPAEPATPASPTADDGSEPTSLLEGVTASAETAPEDPVAEEVDAVAATLAEPAADPGLSGASDIADEDPEGTADDTAAAGAAVDDAPTDDAASEDAGAEVAGAEAADPEPDEATEAEPVEEAEPDERASGTEPVGTGDPDPEPGPDAAPGDATTSDVDPLTPAEADGADETGTADEQRPD